jgi:hypothetical protein
MIYCVVVSPSLKYYLIRDIYPSINIKLMSEYAESFSKKNIKQEYLHRWSIGII